MINVLINGLNGKMGQEVLMQISKSVFFNVAAGVDINFSKTYSFPTYTNVNSISIIPDVIIDFSIPEASLSILNFAVKNHVPLVIATTGFSQIQENKILASSKDLPIFKSSNMSYEINLMSDLISKLAVLLKDSDIEIIETHHRNKIDAPSGTALMLANAINTALKNEMYYEYNRHTKREKRSTKEIGIHSIRGGTETGKHSVIFFGENESLEITHTINSRSILAKGALDAAQFILKQKNRFLFDERLNIIFKLEYVF